MNTVLLKLVWAAAAGPRAYGGGLNPRRKRARTGVSPELGLPLLCSPAGRCWPVAHSAAGFSDKNPRGPLFQINTKTSLP